VNDYIDEGLESASLLENDTRSRAFFEDSSRIVTARGTEEGLILRIDGRATWTEILADLEAFLGQRRKFFEGGQVSIEWLERLPTKQQSKELEEMLKAQYGIEIVPQRRRPERGSQIKDEKVSKREDNKGGVTIPLFDEAQAADKLVSMAASSGRGGVHASLEDELDRFSDPAFSQALAAAREGLGGMSGSQAEAARKRYLNRMSAVLGEDVYADGVYSEDDANAKIVFGTLRSGQRYETPFSLIVVGDVNPGADLVAGGDIIVLGHLRGTAHASAYDDDSVEHVIVALRMQPMQLRIGSVISRGSDDQVRGAEIARIENRRIIVEPFSPRALAGRRFR
jgi:septum formation inhibitor MinC